MTATTSAAEGTDSGPDTAGAVADFRFFALEVLRTRRLGHSFLRVTFGGESLAGFRSGGYDQSLSLFLPPPHREHTVLPSTDEDTWFGAWRAMPEGERPVMRSYTVREQRRTPQGVDEIDIDFVLHGDTSPASAWAGRAVTGRRILAIGLTVARNKSVRFQPPADSDLILMYADETALPAAAAILDRLPRAAASRPGSRSRTRTTASPCPPSRTRTSPGWCGARALPGADRAPAGGRPGGRSARLRGPVRLDRRGVRDDPRRTPPPGTGARGRPAAGAFHRLLAARRERGGAPRGGLFGPGSQRGPRRGSVSPNSPCTDPRSEGPGRFGRGPLCWAKWLG